MKVGDLVKRRSCTENKWGIVVELETFKPFLPATTKHINQVVKVRWIGSNYPAFMYRVEDLTMVSEAK